VLRLVFVRSQLAKDRVGTAGSKLPTERWQDKWREVRPGRRAEEARNISVLQQGAFLARSARFPAEDHLIKRYGKPLLPKQYGEEVADLLTDPTTRPV
jgi:hypothetical protein